MALRHGFKSEAERISVEVRRELDSRPADPLDPMDLAESLGIPVLPLSALGSRARAAVRHFRIENPSAFSALTVFRGSHRLIVNNDGHSPARQASNLAHELAHALLMHQPSPALDERGCRAVDDEIEEEANWLGGVLLVPAPAALRIVRQGLSEQHAAGLYGVSADMLRWRLNMTGARRRGRRASRR